MPITLEQAKALRHGDVLHVERDCSRWRVNGKVQTWKRDPARVRVPLKHGLYRYDYLTEPYLTRFHFERDCPGKEKK